MATEETKRTFEILESIATTIGLLVGAIWVYRRYIRTREDHPKIEFNVDLRYLGRQDGKILIEVVAHMENKGLVRHWVNDFSCDVLVLKSGDPVIHGDKRINYQVLFEKYNPGTDDRKSRIVWIPKDWYETFIDAGVKQEYTYLTSIPDSTSFVCIYSQFHYKNEDFQTAQRAFSVAQLEKASTETT